MEGYAIARQNGWMSANDIRELENLNPLSDGEGGNLYLVNGNMIPITMAGISNVPNLNNDSNAPADGTQNGNGKKVTTLRGEGGRRLERDST